MNKKKDNGKFDDLDLLDMLIQLRDQTVQKQRVAFNNRIKAVEQGRDEMPEAHLEIIEFWHRTFINHESLLDNQIVDLVKPIPVVEEMVEVRGIGKILAAKVISMIDIHECHNRADLWRYCGFAVLPFCEDCKVFIEPNLDACSECGGENIVMKAERKVKGQPLHYNAELKVACYNVGRSLMRVNGDYKQRVYNSARQHYDDNRPDWSKLRRHQAAMRKMIKLWLSHLWEVWRKLEQLPIHDPYVLNMKDHSTYLAPHEFGWREFYGEKEEVA